MSIQIEQWKSINTTEEMKAKIVSQLYANSLIWNGLLQHFVTYLKSEETINFTFNEINTIKEYLLTNNSIPDGISRAIVDDVVSRFETTIHLLYSDNYSGAAPLVRIDVYTPTIILNRYLEDNTSLITVNRETGLVKLDSTIEFSIDKESIPLYFLGIKLKYVIDDNDVENLYISFL